MVNLPLQEWLYKYPDASVQLLDRITNLSIDYLVAQVKAGAQMLQVFESWAGELSPVSFAKFSLPYLKKIAHQVKAKLEAEKIEPVPMVVFAKGAHYALEDLANTDYDVIQIDWTMDPAEARRRVGDNKTLQVGGRSIKTTNFGSNQRLTQLLISHHAGKHGPRGTVWQPSKHQRKRHRHGPSLRHGKVYCQSRAWYAAIP